MGTVDGMVVPTPYCVCMHCAEREVLAFTSPLGFVNHLFDASHFAFRNITGLGRAQRGGDRAPQLGPRAVHEDRAADHQPLQRARRHMHRHDHSADVRPRGPRGVRVYHVQLQGTTGVVL